MVKARVIHSTQGRYRPVVAVLALVCSTAALNCFNDPLTPVSPTWDTNVTLSLSNRTLTLREIVDKNAWMLQVGGGNQLIYMSSTETPPTRVNDRLSISPSDAFTSVKLGAFALSIPPETFPMQLPGLIPGTTGPIPPGTFDVPDIPNAVSVPVNITFASGSVRLTLRNHLQIPISVTTPVIVGGGGTTTATFVFPAVIPPGDSAWAEDDLAGDHIATGDGLTGFHLATTGSGGAAVTIPATALTATLTTRGLMARTATIASIPAQRLTDNDVGKFSLRDSTKVQSLTISSGRLDFTFTSRLPIGVLLRFRLTELKRPGGVVSVEDSIPLPAGGSRVYQLDLARDVLESAAPPALLDSLELVSSVIIPAPVNQQVTLHDTDRVLISMRTAAPIVADTASVVLKPTWINVDATVPFELGQLTAKYTDQLNIPAASLGLGVVSSVGFPADFYVRIVAPKANGDSAVLIAPAGPRRIAPGSGTITFNDAEVGQFLSQLSGKIPASVRIAGKVLVNPPDLYNPSPSGVGRIGRNSSVGGTMNVRIPFHLGITDGVYQDTLDWGDANGDGVVEGVVDRGALEDVNEGTVYAEIHNAMPLQVGVRVQLLDSARQNLLMIPQNGSDISVDAAAVDAGGVVTIPSNGSKVIVLTGAEVRQFIHARYLRYAIALSTTGGGGVVSFRTSDSFRLRLWSQLSARVGK